MKKFKKTLKNLLYKTIGPAGLSLLISLSSCEENKEIIHKQLSGIPINVEVDNTGGLFDLKQLTVLVMDEKGTYKPFSYRKHTVGSEDIYSAKALIKSEL